MSTQVIAYDVHQTLVAWPKGRVEALEVQLALERFGVQISYQAYEASRQATFFLDAPKRPIEGWTDFLALVFARLDLRLNLDVLQSIAAMYESRNDMVLFPDALPSQAAARERGLRTCAFTTLPMFMLGPTGRRAVGALDAYFDASAVGVPKGDRRFYQRVRQMLGVAPDEILCVGDDPICDVRLTSEAGWRAVLLDRDGRHTDTRAGQVAIIDSLSALMDHLL